MLRVSAPVLLLAAALSAQGQGAWPPPWADPVPPAVRDGDATLTGLDRFVVQALEQHGLRPAPRADRRTLLRRAHLVLTGLPPTPDEQEAFFADTGSDQDALARLVDRLLATRAYGERLGRLWLDLARYADTAGDSSDYPVPDAWRYRNWVIDAFCQDLPYDRFLQAQLAGDVLAESAPPEARNDLIIATGFLALARRFGVGPRQDGHLIIEDCIDTIGRSLLGVTLRCARCHDHKYDPIPTADYYGLYGILQSSRFPFPGSEDRRRPEDLTPLVPRATAERLQQQHDARSKQLDATLAAAQAAVQAADRALRTPPASQPASKAQLQQQLNAARTAEQAARRARDAHAATLPFPTAYAMAEGNPGQARIQKGGNPHQPEGEPVPRHFPRALCAASQPAITAGSGRLELARWLTRPDHPFTARVLVNRLWGHAFGQPLVATPGNFGHLGQPPSHPELLDWLARRFVASGWSVKALLRLLLTSRTWAESSQDEAAARAIDPDDRLWWRAARRRLDAEALRDGILAASGALDPTPGQAQPFPPQSQWNWTQHYPFRAVYESDRRTVYLMTQRIQPHPFLALFDGADTNAASDQREASTTPAQMLFLLNDEWCHRQSERLAQRLRDHGGDARGQCELLYRLLLARVPDEVEQAAAEAFCSRYRAALIARATPAADQDRLALAALARTLLASNEYLHVD